MWWNWKLKAIPTSSSGDIRVVNLGCWRDTSHRAIQSLERRHYLLQDYYITRSYPFNKCMDAARSFGYQVFALQHGGQCFSAWDAGSTYTRYGRSIDCGSDGEGGGWANQVYKMLKFGEFRCLFSSLIVTICFF